jgi:hypothetical protein
LEFIFSSLSQIFLYQTNHLTWFRVPAGLELGIDQVAVHFHFEPATRRRLQVDPFDLSLKVL